MLQFFFAKALLRTKYNKKDSDKFCAHIRVRKSQELIEKVLEKSISLFLISVKIIKKLIVMLMCTVIVLGAAKGYMAETAQDYYLYAITYTGDGGDVDTKRRTKETSSSAYIYNCYSDSGVNVRVWGNVKGVWKDCNVGLVVTCGVGEKKWLPNYVYEWNGYKSTDCYLKLSPLTHKKAYIGGRWNPDSNKY